MDFLTRDNIKFTVTGTNPLEENFDLTFSDADTNEVLGTLTVEKKRARAIAQAIREIFRVSFGEFQDHETATIKIDNRSEGTVRFE